MPLSFATICVLHASLVLTTPTDPPRTEPPPTEPPRIAVSVDPRLELLSIVFRFAGNHEFNQPTSNSPYARKVEERFGSLMGHAAIVRARELRNQHSISYDAVASLAMHAKDITTLRIGDGSASVYERLDQRWTLELANDFLELVADFRDESKFAEFFASNEKLYSAVQGRMRDLLDRKLDAAWFAKFYGAAGTATFAVHPGLLLGGQNFGVSVRHPDGREEITPNIGCWEYDGEGVPIFADGVLPIIVHEFCHSYVNPIVDARLSEFKSSGASIFPHVRAKMEAQAYKEWRTVVCESIVRASVVVYLRAHEEEPVAVQDIALNERLGFTWTRDLATLLSDYEANRESYPTFDSFAPRIAAFFDDLAKGFTQAAPWIDEMTPNNGAVDVAPGSQEIVIRFDRPMGPGMSVMLSGAQDKFPPLGPKKVRWDPDRRTLRIDVLLEAGRDYEFGLNTGAKRNFVSEDGVPLEPIVVRFRTREE